MPTYEVVWSAEVEASGHVGAALLAVDRLREMLNLEGAITFDVRQDGRRVTYVTVAVETPEIETPEIETPEIEMDDTQAALPFAMVDLAKVEQNYLAHAQKSGALEPEPEPKTKRRRS